MREAETKRERERKRARYNLTERGIDSDVFNQANRTKD